MSHQSPEVKEILDTHMQKIVKKFTNEKEVLEPCDHIWVSNSGEGGKPEFKLFSHLSATPTMHVKCEVCNCRTWMTQAQWQALEGQ